MDADERFQRRKRALQPDPEDFKRAKHTRSSIYRYKLFAVAYACYLDMSKACRAVGWESNAPGERALKQQWVLNMIEREMVERKREIRLDADDILRGLEKIIRMAMGEEPQKVARWTKKRSEGKEISVGESGDALDQVLMEMDESEDGYYRTHELKSTLLKEARQTFELYGKHLGMWSDNDGVNVQLPNIYLNLSGGKQPIEGERVDEPPQIADHQDDDIHLNLSGVDDTEEDWL